MAIKEKMWSANKHIKTMDLYVTSTAPSRYTKQKEQP